MSSFTDPLIVEVGQRFKRPFRIVNAFHYEIGSKGSGRIIEVAAGFETDGASVPRVFWPVIDRLGRHAKAAVLHDWLYAEKPFSRREADAVFLEAMDVLDVVWWRRYTMWAAVRLFGWRAWRKDRK